MRAAPAKTIQLAPAWPRGVRIPEIDRLKGFALLLVLLYHSGGALGCGNYLHGEVGVDIFLIVSGFVLVLNSTHLTAGEFLRRRFLRIFPSYWAILAIFLLINAHFFADRRSFADIALHVVGLHGFARPEYFSAINDSFWYLSIVVLLYAVFLGLRRHLEDFALVAGTGALLTAAACLYYEHTRSAGGLGHLGVRIPSAFLGILIGQLASGRPLVIRCTPLLVVGLLGAAFVSVYQGVSLAYPIAAFAYIALFLAADRRMMRTRAGRLFAAVFSFLGIYSYEIYLIHQPMIRDYNRLALQQLWGIDSPSRLELVVSMAVAFALVVVAAVVIHRLTERLFRAFRKPALA